MIIAPELMDAAFFEDALGMRKQTVMVLDKLQAEVEAAKSLVHQTQSKVEELAESVDNVEPPPKDTPKKFK
jgi:hypothetical protein